MKIIYYIHALGIGGAEKIVVDYLLALHMRGHSVALVVNNKCGSFLEKRLENQVPVFSLQKDLHISSHLINRIIYITHRITFKIQWRKIINDFKPDIIHIHTMPNDVDLIEIPANRLVFSFHSDVKRIMKLCSQRGLKNLSRLTHEGMYYFAINTSIQEQIKDEFQTQTVFYAPNGIDINEIESRSMSKEAFLIQHNLSPNTFIVGHIGRFNPVKNHGKVLSVFREISKAKKESILLLIGTGSDEEVSSVRRCIEELGIGDKVLILGARPDSIELLSLMDVFLFPSFIEGSPLSLLEAQAKGVRSVVSSTISADVICNSNCIALPLDMSDSDWADVALGKSDNANTKDIHFFDIQNVITNIENCYSTILR